MKRRVLLCSIDGARPDAILATAAPTIERLAGEGACTWKARTVMPSCTLPCHTSMVRGVPTERHGITSNTFTPLVRPVPSLFEAAAAAGLAVGMFYNWEPLRDLAEPGTARITVQHGDCTGPHSDRFLAEQAAAHIARFDLDLIFLYLGYTDEAGHAHGWMSQPYLEAITHADSCLGLVLDAIAGCGRAEETVTLVLSDHGGHERSHGTESDEDMTIPWVLHGPGVHRGRILDGGVRIFDTCVTLAYLLGIPLARAWEGRVVSEALDS